MWYPPDPDEPTSELYRLMPPRRKPSQLREALDAAWGVDSPGGGSGQPPQQRWWRAKAARARPASRRAAGWAWGLATGALAVVIGSLVSAYLLSH